MISIAQHLEISKHSYSTLHLQGISLLSQSPPLASPKLQSYSFQSQCQRPCPGDHCDTSAAEVPSFKRLTTSNSSGFSLCTVRSVNLPLLWALFPRSPSVLRNPPCTGFSTCKPLVSVLIQMTWSGHHRQQEHNGRRVLPTPGVQGTEQCKAVTHRAHAPLPYTNVFATPLLKLTL